MKKPIYERWGSADGREGIQRTLLDQDQADQEFLTHGIRIVDEHGNARRLTTEEANALGVRRCVAAKNLMTGELEPSGSRSGTVLMTVKGS